MDEPTASLTSEEVNHLFKIVRQLKEEGKGIVFISHKLGEIIEIGDRVSVLKDGAYVGTRDVKDVTADDLVTMMVGRTIQNTYQHEDAPDTYENTEVILRFVICLVRIKRLRMSRLNFIRVKSSDSRDLSVPAEVNDECNIRV